MANKGLFANVVVRWMPRADAVNREGAAAYAYGPQAKLAQLAATGTLADSVFAGAEQHLAEALAAARDCDPDFVARAAVYARRGGAMKDMPALLAAYLTVAEPDLAVKVFGHVIDTGRMLRSYVQILRSGQVGRSSLGTRPKRLVTQWLERASMRDLMAAATGKDPSLADIVRMVHPRPADATRRAFYGWLLGKPYDLAALPVEIAAFEAWKRDLTLPLPPVPFQWLTAFPLNAEQWGALALDMGWQALRINLNTLARHGAFGVAGVTEAAAARLAVPGPGVLPYQLLVALRSVGEGVPLAVQAALETALEASLASVPVVPGHVVVCPDVSGSMGSPVTGYRKGATTKVACVDVAALVASAVLRTNGQARVLPFAFDVVDLALDPHARLAANAARLAAVCGGGTAVSAPLARLNRERAKVDLVVIVSDNQSWVDESRHGATATMREWDRLKRRNPNARLVCVDIQPHGTTQATGRPEILNVGGFSDAVFDTIARFARGEVRDWVGIVNETEV
ncbi:RNA-binding protein [uncultured Sphingomonas sp.]|uniref:RNA-binding protein n=1 Tax=uncultured Sphingomonas sp. TaxID=158754 RepID=UPI0025EE4490|nr:RNA-binding protein [uncultured Sphingomonas sp.]